MTDDNAEIGSDGLAPSAGAMLRAAREQCGVHIAALSASIKVPQRKLEALEADRYDELVDMTFTRALAQTVCRSLRVDAKPVLDRLPDPDARPSLIELDSGINEPMRERPGRRAPSEWSWLGRPVFWGTLLVLAAAAALALMPEQFLGRARMAVPRAASSPAAAAIPAPALVPAVAASAPVPAAVAEAASAPPKPPAAVAAPAPVATGGDKPLRVQASASSWIEVQDANGTVLVSRELQADETLSVGGTLPLRVTVGNAGATKLLFRGRSVDLTPNTLGNVARLQLP